MKNLSAITVVLVSVLLMGACQLQNSSQQEIPTSGKIMSGELSGSEFAIATGNELDNFMKIVEAFNRMDAEGIWAFSADTVSMRGADGTQGHLTQADFEGLFSTIDSLSWDIDSVVPLQVTGTSTVKIMADTREVFHMKDGSVMRTRLFEEFTFEDGILTGVRQWTADLPESTGSM